MARFKKGQSGNPKGRTKGTSNAAKLRDAIEHDLPEIIVAMVNAAKEGDTAAAKMLLDRAIPSFKPVQHHSLIAGLDGASLADQGSMIVGAMANGRISIEQAQQALTALTSLARLSEAAEFEERLTALENSLNNSQ